MPKYALGNCDRCGFTYLLHELRMEIRDRVATGRKTCPTCWDADHPQLQAGRRKLNDPVSLGDEARPDLDTPHAINQAGWNPVISLGMRIWSGKVEVS